MWILGLKGLKDELPGPLLVDKKVSFKSNLPSKKIHKSWTTTQDFFWALIKVLARRVSSRPMDAHFWKKHKENSPNLSYVYGKT